MAYDFNTIAKRYDRLNHLMTWGMDRGWRRRAVRALRLERGSKVLDVACGTGDMVVELAKQSCRVNGVDISSEMLAIARSKCRGAVVEVGDAELLPFPDDTFAAVTCAFGVRNFLHLRRGLAEMVRVVRPGGQVAVLELSTPDSALLRPFYNLYTHSVIPLLGSCVAGNSDAYRYLVSSIERFPKGRDFMKLLEDEGCQVHQRKLFFGVCRLYLASKPQK